jgi:hypothetical protein
MENNPLGPLGARALAPGLAAASRLEELDVTQCGLGSDGVANLIPADGQVNLSLTNLRLAANGFVGGDKVVALASRCTNLDYAYVNGNSFSSNQLRRLDLLLDRKRLCTEAKALRGSPPSVVFRKLVQANAHEHGLSAAFVILRDYIFAEQQKARSSVEQKVPSTTGVKHKR